MWLKTNKWRKFKIRLEFVCVCVLFMQQMHNGELFLSIHKFHLTRIWCIVVM